MGIYPPQNKVVIVVKYVTKYIRYTYTLCLSIHLLFYSMSRAVFHTALAIVPPSSATRCWSELQRVRADLRDKGFYRWPPHVNLVYPFVDTDRFEEAAHMLTRELSLIKPFDIQLQRFETFGGSKKGVCYLAPDTDPSDRIVKLYERVHSAMSQLVSCSEPDRFIPHLTVAHTRTATEAQTAAQAATQNFTPETFHVEEIYILHRCPPTDQYHIAWRIPLGTALKEGGDVQGPIYCSSERFENMPFEEEEWVREVSRGLSAKTNKQKNKINKNDKLCSKR